MVFVGAKAACGPYRFASQSAYSGSGVPITEPNCFFIPGRIAVGMRHARGELHGIKRSHLDYAVANLNLPAALEQHDDLFGDLMRVIGRRDASRLPVDDEGPIRS